MRTRKGPYRPRVKKTVVEKEKEVVKAKHKNPLVLVDGVLKPKRGRPPLKKSSLRKWKNFRVTEVEDKALTRARGKTKISEFCREALVAQLKVMGYLKP